MNKIIKDFFLPVKEKIRDVFKRKLLLKQAPLLLYNLEFTRCDCDNRLNVRLQVLQNL